MVLEHSQPVDSLLNAAMAFLRRYPPFDEMDDGAMRFLAGQLSLAYYPKSSTLLSPDEGVPRHLFIVQRGLVQMTPAEGFHPSATGIVTLGPGECFSVYALMEKRPTGSPYTAAADTFCYLLPAEAFFELLLRSKRFQEFSTHYLRSLLQESRRLIQMHSASSAAEQHAMNRALREIVKQLPVCCQAHTEIGTALRLMHDAHVGSIVIVSDTQQPIGIFTRHDVLDRVTLAGRPLTDPIGSVMTAGPVTLQDHASAYEAALLIASHGIRHVPLTQEGKLSGVITERDLFAVQRVSVRGINRVIARAHDAPTLEQAGRDVRTLARTLLAQGVAAEQLTHLITALNDTLSQRIIAIVQKEHDLQGIQWCWLTFGSEGRMEQTISTDQDNGLLYTCGSGGGTDTEGARQRLLGFATDVNQLLDRCGFPLCKGQIMASNPRWCLSLDEWRVQFAQWVKNTHPEALLNSVIFFDFRTLYGDGMLPAALREHLHDLIRDYPRFLKQLAQYALETKPPLGLFSDFTTEQADDGTAFIDLKKSAARLFVDAARVLAFAAGVDHTNTAQRLRGIGALLKTGEDDIASAVEAFFFIQQLRLRGQLAAHAQEAAHPNRVAPASLNEIDRRILKESLRQARKLQSRLALDYQL